MRWEGLGEGICPLGWGARQSYPHPCSTDLVLFICLFVFIWLHWVFVAACELSLVAMLWILTVTASLVQSMGSRVCGLH